MSQVFSNIQNSFNTTNTIYITPDDESKILAWLSPLEPRVRHQDIRSQRVGGIGDWLLETSEFRRWHSGSRDGESNHKILFCEGNPGVGKSYITSLVIDKLCDEAREADTTVVCFYYDFAARNEQSPANMLGSLLRQLVSTPGGIPEAIVQGYQKQRGVIGGRGLQVSEILAMFQAITATKRTFLCVDALDECAPEHQVVVLNSLRQVLRGSPNTRIFMTGRPQVRSEVEWRFDGAATFMLIRPTEDGVIRYLRDKLRNDTARGRMDATLEAEILEIIPGINSETFLLASLHIKAILRGTTIASRRKALKSIQNGAGLGDTYDATLERINSQSEEEAKLAMATLTWLCYSERPLQVDELCHALAVEIGATDFDPDNIPSIDTLLHCCQGLIAVDKKASTVRLIHYTVQEYLCSHPSLPSKPHSILAESCLAYLNSQQVKNLTSPSLPDHQIMPFLKYSSRYWGEHARKELSDHARTLALELLGQYEDHISAVSLFDQVIGYINTSPGLSGLHAASFFGIVELVTTIINAEDCRVNQPDCRGRTPLSWAASSGHEGVVKAPLGRKDVNPNLSDPLEKTPLMSAADKGREGVVRLLLEQKDIDPNHLDYFHQTPLYCAATNGHEGIAKLLLERKDIDPNRPGYGYETPLGCAAIRGHEGVVKLLLEREDVDPNRPGSGRTTPLAHAAFGGHEGVVKLLLEREDVNPNRPNNKDQTPLYCATIRGHEGVVKLLLGRKDIDPNHPDWERETPLAHAATIGHEGAIKLLLEREDIDPDMPDKYGHTPLSRAAEKGHVGIVKPPQARKSLKSPDPHRPIRNKRPRLK